MEFLTISGCGSLLLRADAGRTIGMGHVMRCLALAQAWQNAGGRAHLACHQVPESLATRLLRCGLTCVSIQGSAGTAEDANATALAARDVKAEWVVLDGYDFNAQYQSRIRETGLRLLVVDDWGRIGEYKADVILDQNLCVSDFVYAKQLPKTRLLLGPRYALLRQEFSKTTRQRPEAGTIGNNILVTIGGADPDNVTAKVVTALTQVGIHNLNVKAVIGDANPHRDELAALAKEVLYSLELISAVAEEMPALMTWADLAITAGGTTCWELCCLGVPHLILITAKNQVPIATELGRHSQVNLGWTGRCDATHIAGHVRRILKDAERRKAMSSAAADLVDGRGAVRVVCHLRTAGLRLRKAVAEDCERFWHWRNDSTVRAASFNDAPIPWKQHQTWFQRKLGDNNTHFFVGVAAAGEPVGQVRLDRSGTTADINVVVAPECRARGYGTAMLDLALSAAFQELGLVSIKAQIKTDNAASIRSFECLGFRRGEELAISGSAAVEYELHKEAYCGRIH